MDRIHANASSHPRLYRSFDLSLQTAVPAYIGHWECCIADDSAPFCVAGMLSAEMAALPAEVALEVRGDFDDLALWLEHVLESGVRGKQFKLGASVQIEARKFVSLVYGAMLAARAYGDATLFRDVTADAVEKLVKPRKTIRME